MCVLGLLKLPIHPRHDKKRSATGPPSFVNPDDDLGDCVVSGTDRSEPLRHNAREARDAASVAALASKVGGVTAYVCSSVLR